MHNSQYWINKLSLEPHPEGGYFRRIYAAQPMVQTPNGKRHCATAIHYLLEANDFSAWHRIPNDELWFHHEGGSLLIRTLSGDGLLNEIILGSDHCINACIPANTWFCSELMDRNSHPFSLVSCVVSPGFDFKDFEMGNAANLSETYPQHKAIIDRLCRD